MHSKAHYLFIFENQIQQGPLPPGRVQRMLRDGEITDAALVWRERLTEWQPISSVLQRLAGWSERTASLALSIGEPLP
ncbi:MAG: DUF4339 domain-containing protein [Chthoniobacterales bacterium]|nr:DUF4339 domain-containing protein [Chthoniobacterales bacterium]